MPLQIRRGTNAERLSLLPSTGLVEGEIIYVTDEQRLYIGTGLPGGHQGIPVTNLTVDDAKDAAAASLVDGTHQGISFSYDNITSTVNATVDLSSYQGVIRADALRGSLFADDSSLLVNAETGEFNGTLVGDSQGYHTGDVKGSLFADDSTLLVDGLSSEFNGTLIGNSQGTHTGDVKGSDDTVLINSSTSSFNLEGTIKGNVYPDSTEVYDLGTSGARFKDLYLSGSSIHLGNATITSLGSAVNLPLGSTVGGVEIGTTSFAIGSDYNINIISDDSTVMVNTATGEFTGNLNGSVYADDNSLLVDAVTGTLKGTFEGQATLNATKIYADVWYRDIGVSVYSASNTGGGGYVDCNVSENTTANPQPLAAGDFVGGFRVNAYTAADEFVASMVVGSELTPTANLSSPNPESNAIIAVANDTTFTEYKFNANGTFASAGAVQVGVFTDTPETRPTGVKGMIIFNDTTGKFQGYTGSAWVDLN